jgi:hypothetical protein
MCMGKRVRPFAAIVALLAAGGCAGRGSSDESNSGYVSLTSPTTVTASSSSGGTLKETLTGPAVSGVVPEGQALADESRFPSGGNTILTVQIRKVNLPDGTILGVSIDFTPLGSIALAQGAGSVTVSLGHFGVSRDSVAVKNGGVTILSGGSFQ